MIFERKDGIPLAEKIPLIDMAFHTTFWDKIPQTCFLEDCLIKKVV